MIGWAGLYLHALRDAEAEGEAAAEMARRVNHQRAELLSRLLVTQVRTERNNVPAARQSLSHGLELAKRLGARNFEAHLDVCSARLLAGEGHLAESLAAARTALKISRQTGLRYCGPTALGIIALVTENGEERRSALAEGEAILTDGAVGHNYFWFYRSAIEVGLSEQDWPAVDRYATALDQYTAAEPLPWSDFVSAQGRALAALGQGRQDAALADELRRLRDLGGKLDMGVVLSGLEGAINCGL